MVGNLIIDKHAFNNSQDTVLAPRIIASVANIVAENIVMKEEPNLVSHNLKFFISMAESLFIDLCDFFNEDNPSFLDVVVHVYMNS
jgi:hypothetical protein